MPEACSFVKNLDGKWAFSWVNIPDKRPVDFYNPNFDASGWDSIAVAFRETTSRISGLSNICRATGTCKVLEKTGLCATASPYTSIRKSYSGIR